MQENRIPVIDGIKHTAAYLNLTILKELMPETVEEFIKDCADPESENNIALVANKALTTVQQTDMKTTALIAGGVIGVLGIGTAVWSVTHNH